MKIARWEENGGKFYWKMDFWDLKKRSKDEKKIEELKLFLKKKN